MSVEPGVRYAAIYYKLMEIERDKALTLHNGKFDAMLCISNVVDCAFSGGLTMFRLLSDLYAYQNLIVVLKQTVQVLVGVVMTLQMM